MVSAKTKINVLKILLNLVIRKIHFLKIDLSCLALGGCNYDKCSKRLLSGKDFWFGPIKGT